MKFFGMASSIPTISPLGRPAAKRPRTRSQLGSPLTGISPHATRSGLGGSRGSTLRQLSEEPDEDTEDAYYGDSSDIGEEPSQGVGHDVTHDAHQTPQDPQPLATPAVPAVPFTPTHVTGSRRVPSHAPPPSPTPRPMSPHASAVRRAEKRPAPPVVDVGGFLRDVQQSGLLDPALPVGSVADPPAPLSQPPGAGPTSTSTVPAPPSLAHPCAPSASCAQPSCRPAPPSLVSAPLSFPPAPPALTNAPLSLTHVPPSLTHLPPSLTNASAPPSLAPAPPLLTLAPPSLPVPPSLGATPTPLSGVASSSSSSGPDEALTLSRSALYSLLQNFGAEVARNFTSAPVALSAPVVNHAAPVTASLRMAPDDPTLSGIPGGLCPSLSSGGSFLLAPGSRPLLGAPPVASAELDPNVMPIPLRIQRVFNAGWVTYVPLDQLTNAACHRALSASGRHGDSALSLSALGELQVSAAKFDLSKERHLSAYEFMQASKTLVWVICHCLKAGPEGQIGGPTVVAIANSFEQHYDRIQHRHDFGNHFPVYLAYDIYIHHAYLQSGGTISVHDWHRLVFEKKMQDHMTDTICRTLNQSSDLLFGNGSSSSSTSSKDSSQSFRSSSEAASSRSGSGTSQR
ncbi:hypothetical protein C0992_003773 [Termitomyces sp. T32_za158]|nr:hypothetical protein C0992_003773 [Termitomyces sp. T32_za158]